MSSIISIQNTVRDPFGQHRIAAIERNVRHIHCGSRSRLCVARRMMQLLKQSVEIQQK